ncbi:hypothetical protein N9Z83_00260 [Akkermansiaceae bacterium]|nr:hypothetical protein [Akkermansiaceae bacterium]
MKIHPFTFILTILAVLIVCLSPFVRKAQKSADRSKVTCNLKKTGIMIAEFEHQYGHRPLPDTKIDFPIPYPQRNRTDSNAILGQLIASGICDTEKIFVLNLDPYPSDLSDDNYSSASEILKAGECHFTYITNQNDNQESPESGALPVLITHFVPGTSRLDPQIFDHHAAYLTLDSSVAICKVTPEGNALVKGRGNLGLFDHGPDTLWGDFDPKLHHPLPFEQSSHHGTFIPYPLSIILYPIMIYLLFRFLLTVKGQLKRQQSVG